MHHQIRWTAEKIAKSIKLIQPLIYRRRQVLADFRCLLLSGPQQQPPIAPHDSDEGWPSIPANSYWGEWRRDFVLRTTFSVPPDWPQDAPIALHIPLGVAGDFSHPETLAYIDGRPLAACDRHHQEIILPDHLRDGRSHLLALHGWTGLGGWIGSNPHMKLFMQPSTLVQIDQPTRDFIATVRAALGVAGQISGNQPAKERLYNALDSAYQKLDLRQPFGDAFYKSVAEAHQTLQAAIASAGPPLDVHVIAAGHAHIDLAWLWTIAQTRLKASRTFHTVLHLMEQFPNYHFTQSQPQIYEYISQDQPQLFQAIKQQIAKGRWEPTGGMWVEADCNITGAEALARQFLLGRSYFRRQFGSEAESPILWLPDVFGYAWNLPQLIKEAGLEYFFTIKISWSQYNRMPYDSFWWQGLDGTRVLTHFSTTLDDWSLNREKGTQPTTYNANAAPLEIISTWTNAQQKEIQHVMLMAFGYGDGGGGPTAEMLENIRELAQFPAAPQVKNGRAIDFFRRLEQTAGEKLPTWNGELYLEYHRGTYTTQAATKRSNRKSEFLLHDAEFLAAWAALSTDFQYPHDQLTQAWKLLCLNQFHDILPGSSIKEVYEDSEKDYAVIKDLATAVRDAALVALGQHLPSGSHFIAVNPTSFAGPRTGILPETLEEGHTLIDLADNQPILTQPIAGGTLIQLPQIPPYGQTALKLSAQHPTKPADPVSIHQDKGRTTVENDHLRLIFESSGDLVEIYDKTNERQVLTAGERANQFQAFEDRPLDWDAWDIDLFYEDKMWTAEAAHDLRIIETGPLRVGLEIQRRILNSTIKQRITLYHDSRRIDFDTHIDWQERHILLKVAFPVNILSPVATYDVQWGNVQRPTHRNTSWDWARFESCAHKWVDLSEGDYGVSLLNDCKYGHDIHENIMRLTLLRSPTFPDPQADRGHHHFQYSLLPHPGDWRQQTVGQAYHLNDPLILRRTQGGAGSLPRSLVSIDAENVIIETVKQAEDGQGIIVRLYENQRNRGQVTLRAALPITAAYRCNLLEENQHPLLVSGSTVHFTIKPYQVITLKLAF